MGPRPASAWRAFWRSVTRFERSKIAGLLALRNAFGIAAPLALGVAAGNPTAGLIACIGALNVSYSDGDDPYRYRARRMAAASILCGLAVLAGGLCARKEAIAVTLATLCAFAGGLMVAVGSTAADMGTITLVTLIVFSAHPMSALAALQSGAAALAGGFLQTAVTLAIWPARRYGPEKRALADLYAALAHAAGEAPDVHEAPPATAQSTAAQTALAGLSGDRSLKAERYLALLSQAERVRLGLLSLNRLRSRMAREEAGGPLAETVARCLGVAREILEALAGCLRGGQELHAAPQLEELRALTGRLSAAGKTVPRNLAALLNDARSQLDALAGQLRSAEELATHSAPSGTVAFARSQAAQPVMLRLTGALAAVRANLSLDSAAMRHALRLAVCVAIGDVASLAAGWTRAYWCPMTIAIVLKPDFSGTFSRGVLRVGGTLVGLGFATALFHALSPGVNVQVALIAVLAFLLRYLGPANYGIFVLELTALVVLLIALTGVPPAQVIAARGLNTVAGGAIALVAYALWPTWERTRLPEELARLLDAYRAYFEAVRDAYVDPAAPLSGRLDRTRQAARLARSNLEASAARFRGEPGAAFDRVTVLDAILANSHRFIHAVMSLEAGLARSRRVPARPEFRSYAADVSLTLSRLVSALHGAPILQARLPDLRGDHSALVHSGDARETRYALVNLETDRITNSLNTIVLEVMEWTGAVVSRR